MDRRKGMVVDLRTLQQGPLWVLSALAGTGGRFSARDLATFWDSLVEVALHTPEPARAILVSLTQDRAALLEDFAFDERPLVSGFAAVVRALAGLPADTAADYRLALLRIGTRLGRARGPYGDTISGADTQLLLLVAELLEIRATPAVGDVLV